MVADVRAVVMAWRGLGVWEMVGVRRAGIGFQVSESFASALSWR